MSTLNHDTELEEIIEEIRAGFNLSQGPADNRTVVEEAKAALNTYLYKQTLELIGEDIPAYVYIDALIDNKKRKAINKYKTQLRKAAAERWGQ